MIKVAGEVELTRLIDLAAQQSDVSVRYDPAVVRGTVTVRSNDGLTSADLWDSIGRLLAIRGFAVVQAGEPEQFQVVRLNEAKAAGTVRGASEPRSVASSFEFVLLEVEHVASARIVEAITPLLTGQGSSAEPITGTNLILIADRPDRIDAALEMATRLDRVGNAMAVRRVVLESGDPARVAAELQQIAARLSVASGRATSTEFLPGSTGRSLLLVGPTSELDRYETLARELAVTSESVTKSYKSPVMIASDLAELIRATTPSQQITDVRITVSRPTDSVLVSADEGVHASIQSLIDDLEKDISRSTSGVTAIQMRYRPAREIEELLSALDGRSTNDRNGVTAGDTVDAQPGDDDVSSATSAAAESLPRALAGNVALPALDQLSVSVDESTNSLIVSGDPLLVRQLERVVRVLDVQAPQVLLEVMLVSLTESETLDLGVELTKLIDDAGIIVGLSSLFGLSSITANSTDVLPSGSGGTGVVLDPGDFSVVVRALETVNDGRSVSMPRLLVLNNQEGTFDSVLQQPFTSTNASDTVATTSFGGSSDAGTQVSVRPQIVAGDRIMLEYAIGLSTFTGEATDPNLPPPRQENSLASTATIPDSFVVAVGGIELTTEGEGESRTPGLSKIPLVGELFKSRSRSDSTTRFYVFIRATVLRNQSLDDLKFISVQEAERAEVDDGWPEVAPRVIR